MKVPRCFVLSSETKLLPAFCVRPRCRVSQLSICNIFSLSSVMQTVKGQTNVV